MKNEVLQHKMIKQYKDYYEYYNKVLRPREDKVEARTVDGAASWKETNVGLVTIKEEN